MAKRATPRKYAGISDAAVRKRTGRTWAQWVRVLDGAGCRSMAHKQIAVIVHRKFGVGDWWSQMVTVGYEQAAGLRRRHERADGQYSVSKSRVMDAAAVRAYDAWADDRIRERWLPGSSAIVIRKGTRGMSLRITWTDEATNVVVNFYRRATGRCQVVVQHDKLPSAKQARQMQGFWTARLDALRQLLTP